MRCNHSWYWRTLMKVHTDAWPRSLHSAAIPSSIIVFFRLLYISGPPKSPLHVRALRVFTQNWFVFLEQFSSSIWMARFIGFPLRIAVGPQPEAIIKLFSSIVGRPKGRQMGFIVLPNWISLTNLSSAILSLIRPSLLMLNVGYNIVLLMP